MGILKTLTVNGTTYKVVNTVPADSVTLLASAWEGKGEVYSQVVEVPGVTASTKVDLQPTAEQLAEFHYKVLSFVAENDDGVITVYSIGDKPEGDHTIQITKTEVDGTGKIRGNTVGTTMPRPDWNQGDPTKADYIRNKPYVTPQMFGAVGDGVADDTEAVQAALDNGGHIYFPAGRYKVTQRLTASKSCRIEMFKPYPNTYGAEYPLTAADNWMGARIETYSTDGGMVIGDDVEVNGLFLRAMEGFQGTLLKYDNSMGKFSYPAAIRISHVKLEIDKAGIIPECMFDFAPNGSYNYLLNDIVIGRSAVVGYCVYAFKADVSTAAGKPGSIHWANTVCVKNLCIDIYADYPLYLDGADVGHIWQFDALNIQAYPYNADDKANVTKRTGHKTLVTLRRLHMLTFISSILWDVNNAHYEKIFDTFMLNRVCSIGCCPNFDRIENEIKAKVKDNLDITNLEITIEGNADGTENIVRLTDGKNVKLAAIPVLEPSDEQIALGVGAWMDENAVAKEVAGRNKLDVNNEQCVAGSINPGGGVVDNAHGYWVTPYIPVEKYDVVRMGFNDGVRTNPYNIAVYGSDKAYIGQYLVTTYDALTAGTEILFDGAAYIRCSLNPNSFGSYEDRANNKICLTLNDADVSYEPYGTYLKGGIGDLMVLQSPNGTQYTLAVTDDGTLIAVPSTTQ